MNPYSNSSKPTFRWGGGLGPSPPRMTRVQFECSHSKCTGSIEFSWHCSQLHGTSENTTCTKPLPHVNGSHVGTSGAGGGPRYAHRRPAFASTGYALIRTRSLKRAWGCAVSSNGCSRHRPVCSHRQPW